MKYRILIGFAFSLVLFTSCEAAPLRSFYRPVLPELPRHWKEVLGEPHWRLEWIGEGGSWLEWEGAPGREPPSLSLIQEWTSAVLASPFWPARDLFPGMMRPCGALFPWDVSGGEIVLNWKGGVDAVFWKELAEADRPSAATEGRLPWYFDWPRFRELLESGNIAEVVRSDPWLVDWRSIAERTVLSGFDRRRIVSRQFTELVVLGFGGRWIGSSPFALPLDAPPDGPLRLNVTGIPDIQVSSGGILKCSTSGWVYVNKR